MGSHVETELMEFSRRIAPFDNHYFHLGDGVWTLDSLELDQPTLERLNINNSHFRLTYQVKQTYEAMRTKDWSEIRVLDLGAAEGMHGIEFAMSGCKSVVGIEGRPENTAKAEFARQTLGLDNIRFETADIRGFDPAAFEPFDLILCLGLLYHLEFADVATLLPKLRSALADRGALFIDTLYSGLDSRPEPFEYESKRYRGRNYREHAPGTSSDEMVAGSKYRSRREMLAGGRYSSIENEFASLIEKSSLASLLGNSGFRNVWEVWEPSWNYGQRSRRVTLACTDRPRVTMHAAPGMDINREPPPFVVGPEYSAMVGAPRLKFAVRLARWILAHQVQVARTRLVTRLRSADARR